MIAEFIVNYAESSSVYVLSTSGHIILNLPIFVMTGIILSISLQYKSNKVETWHVDRLLWWLVHGALVFIMGYIIAMAVIMHYIMSVFFLEMQITILIAMIIKLINTYSMPVSC